MANSATITPRKPNWARDWIICGSPRVGPWVACRAMNTVPTRIPAAPATIVHPRDSPNAGPMKPIGIVKYWKLPRNHSGAWCQTLPCRSRDDRLRGAQEHLGERDRVDTQVEQQAVTQLGVVGLGRRVHGVAHPEVRGHRAHLADRPVGHQLAQPGHGRAEPGPHRLHGEAAGRAGRRDDLPGRRRGDRERLLHQDRLAGSQRSQGQRTVVRMRGGSAQPHPRPGRRAAPGRSRAPSGPARRRPTRRARRRRLRPLG